MSKTPRPSRSPLRDRHFAPEATSANFGGAPSYLLVLVFALSGCSALIYEIVWFQLLEFIIGSSAVSLGVLLAVYMGGLCVGSLASVRLSWRRQSALRIYAWLEFGIAVAAALAWLELPALRAIYARVGGFGVWGITLRIMVAGLCLLPPTILMGATLPTVARWVRATTAGLSWVGWLYAANTFGAVVGCLTAGFYLLRVYDMPTATIVAIVLNVIAGTLALTMSGQARPHHSVQAQPVANVAKQMPHGDVLVLVFLSGLTALGAEVVWTRLLSLLLGATVYTFSIILAVVLSGIALGGAIGSQVVKSGGSPRRALLACQLLTIISISWAAIVINESLPFWPIAPAMSQNLLNNFQLDLVRCAWATLPSAMLWGATFPLAVAAAPTPDDPGRGVASLYAANTVGAIVGSLGFTFVVIPMAGTQGAQQIMLWCSFAAAIAAVVPALRVRPLTPRVPVYVMLLIGAALGAFALGQRIQPVSGELIAFGRGLAYRRAIQDPRTGQRVPLPRPIYVGEGMNESVAVTDDNRVRMFHVSGKIEASTSPKDMRLQRLLGAVPALVHPAPRSVLIVGFGAGVTAGTFLKYPSITRVVICELEPLIPKHIAAYFDDANNHIRSDSRVTIVYDDARHFMLTTKERFDIVTSDPIHPWVKGAAALYSREYFELVRARLNPGGLVTQWVPLYQSSERTIKQELATFVRVFPGATVWANRDRGLGYDLVLLGGLRPARIQLDSLDLRLKQPESAGVVQDLQKVGYESWSDLLATYAGRDPDLRPWLSGAEINVDRSLRLQYQAGLESLFEQEANIYQSMTQYRSFPSDLFVGSSNLVSQVMEKGAE